MFMSYLAKIVIGFIRTNNTVGQWKTNRSAFRLDTAAVTVLTTAAGMGDDNTVTTANT